MSDSSMPAESGTRTLTRPERGNGPGQFGPEAESLRAAQGFRTARCMA